MPATSQITFINECRSFGSEQYNQKRDTPKRIPRSPNAFMLYRSDFLKRRAVPPEVEKRQQNLSRIAGQCWNMLPDTEKAIWYSKAAVVRAEHRARYPSHTTGPFHKDTNRHSARDKRKGSAANSGPSFSRSRARQKQSPYCEGMFAVLHDSKVSSPASQASLLSPTPTSVSPFSTTASLSPLSLPHSLPPFTSHTQPSWQVSPPATSENSMIWRDKVGYLLGSSGPKTPHWGLSHIIRDCEITLSEIGSSPEPYPTLPQCEDSFASCVPCSGLEQPPKLRSDQVAQVSPTLPGSNTLSPARYHSANCHSLANDLGVTDDLAHFNQFLVPLFPWQVTN